MLVMQCVQEVIDALSWKLTSVSGLYRQLYRRGSDGMYLPVSCPLHIRLRCIGGRIDHPVFGDICGAGVRAVHGPWPSSGAV